MPHSKRIRKTLLKYKGQGFIESNGELASVIDTSERRAGLVFEGKADLWGHELVTLQHYFGGQKRLDLSLISVPEGYKINRKGNITINGSTLDELKDMVKEMGEAEAHKETDIDEALEDIQQMRVILDSWEAELKNMK